MGLDQSQLDASSDSQETLKPPGVIFSLSYTDTLFTLWSISRIPQKVVSKTSPQSVH